VASSRTLTFHPPSCEEDSVVPMDWDVSGKPDSRRKHGRLATVEMLLEDGNVTFMKHERGEFGESQTHRGCGGSLEEEHRARRALLGLTRSWRARGSGRNPKGAVSMKQGSHGVRRRKPLRG